VWHIRDELARDSEVLHLRWGVSYKSGVYAVKALCLTPGGLSVVRASKDSHANWARREPRRSTGRSQQRA